MLIETLEEYERRRNFLRIYPSYGTNYYDNLFESCRNNHKIVYKYLYGPESIIELNDDLYSVSASLRTSSPPKDPKIKEIMREQKD